MSPHHDDASDDRGPPPVSTAQLAVQRAFLAGLGTPPELVAGQSVVARLLSDQARRSMSPAFAALNQQVSLAVNPAITSWLEADRARLERWRTMINDAVAPMLTHVQRFQSEMAKSLAIQTGLGLQSALEQVANAAAIHSALPDVAGLRRIDELLASDVLHEDALDAAEASMAEDPELLSAIEAAADKLAETHKWLTRQRARRLIVTWVWLMWSAAVFAASLVPGVGGLVNAAGLDSKTVAGAAGKGFDHAFPPEDED